MAKPNNANIADDLYTFDVYKLYLLDEDTGLELYTDTLTDSQLNFSEEVVDVRAGVGNVLLTQIPTNKSASIEITDVKSRLDWMAAKQGTKIQSGVKSAWHLPKTYVAVTDASKVVVNLDAEPKVPADVRALKVDEATGEVTELTGTVSAKKITFDTGVQAGDKVWVTGFTYDTTAEAQYVTFDSSLFAKAFKVVIEGVVYNAKKRPVFKKQYIFHQMSIDGSFSDATQSERQAQSNATTLTAQLPTGQTELGYVVFIPLA